MTHVSDVIRLSNGVELPKVGLGTFRAIGNDVKTAVRAALNHGIRHIDTASIYKVGEAAASCAAASHQGDQGLSCFAWSSCRTNKT